MKKNWISESVEPTEYDKCIMVYNYKAINNIFNFPRVKNTKRNNSIGVWKIKELKK